MSTNVYLICFSMACWGGSVYYFEDLDSTKATSNKYIGQIG